jgi:4,5-dihydroxyphthalate decarboxylase
MLRLTLAAGHYDRTEALRDGRVRAEGIDLTYIMLRVEEIFWRMAQHREFDASEFSLGGYVVRRGRGADDLVAIPVFPSRFFRQSCIFVHEGSRVRSPEDLRGKRIGVPEYSMTAAVFARGLLLHEYGVKPETIEWFSGTQDGLQRPTRIDFELPGVTLTRMPLEQDMGPMLETGGIDAIISPNAPKALARPDSPVRRLFPDYRHVEKEYFARTGIFPIMHTIVLRKDIYEKHPWAAASLYDAFVKAKEWAYAQLLETDALKLTLPWVVAEAEETRRIMGDDFWPYGIERNRVSLEALPQYLYEQHLASRVPRIDELFAPVA